MSPVLTVSQRVPAPPEQVYDAWLTAEGLARWWWVAIPDTTYDVDARPGGTYRVRSERAGIGVHGTFLTLTRPSLIEMTWFWSEADVTGPEEHVRVDLVPDGDGTLVTVTHTVADPAAVGDYRQGWEYVLGNLTSYEPERT